jgi:predicted hotdog family 3-hydroxylacyl-ACP dehydratase
MRYESVEELLLHRPPMLLVDAVTDYSADRATCIVTVRDDPPFGGGGEVPGLVALEYMAQAVGTYVGLRAIELGELVLPGFLIGVPHLDVQVERFEVGERLTATVHRTFGDRYVGSFDTELLRERERVASATLRAFRGDPRDIGMESAAP